MKQLNQYIQEKLHVSKYKKDKIRYLSNKDLPQDFLIILLVMMVI